MAVKPQDEQESGVPACHSFLPLPLLGPRRERWAVLRDFVEEREQLTVAECRMLFELGMSEPDRNVGTAVMCGVLYRRTCPADVREAARVCDRAAVRRTAFATAPRS